MAKNQTLDDFYKSFREEVLCASDTETSGWTTDDFLTAVMLEYLEEAGEVTGPVICPFRDRGLQMNAYAVISDSGTLPEESSYFTSIGKPFPSVCIRTSTERPEALDKGCFVLAGIDGNSLLQAVETAVKMNDDGDYGIPVPDYTDENVSTKVVKLIQSYTGVVNKMVWRKF